MKFHDPKLIQSHGKFIQKTFQTSIKTTIKTTGDFKYFTNLLTKQK